MAESNNGVPEFKTRTYSTERKNYDRLLSVFHIGTDVKRCLLGHYIREKGLYLLNWLTHLNQTFLKFDDVKRAIKRSSRIQLKDLDLSTIDILLRFHCFEMFWDLCLLNTRLEEILNSHKDELFTIYQNSKTKDSLSPLSTEQYTPSLSKYQWELLFKSGVCCRINGEGNVQEFSATEDITLSSFDETLNVLLLYTVCPLFHSVITVCECQIQISKLAVLNSECDSPTFKNLWKTIESHIIKIAAHCRLSDDFTRDCKTAKQTFFNITLSQENRKPILEEAFNNPNFIMNRQFCNRVREELERIKIDDNLNLARKLCGQEIPILLIDGRYTKGAYSLSVVENADKNLTVLKSVCSNQVMETDQNETEVDMQTDDIQTRINKHSHLKVVQLITDIAKGVLVDVLKRRLAGTDFEYALFGMKNRIFQILDPHERQVLYPDRSSYSGDLADLDINLLYIILRNLNTIKPHLNGWGYMPKDDDRSMSANIDRIRFFKNKYVSHSPTQSLGEDDFLQTWEEIRQCIIELGGVVYKKGIGVLFTSEINPVMEQELLNTLRRLKKKEKQNELYYSKIKEDLNEIKQQLRRANRQPVDNAEASDASLGSVPLEMRIEGQNIPLVEGINKRTNDLSIDDMRITYVKEGSIIIGLKVSALALHTVGKFIGMIDTLLLKLLQVNEHYGNGHTTHIVASVNFMDKQNEPIGFPTKKSFGVAETTKLQETTAFTIIDHLMEVNKEKIKVLEEPIGFPTKKGFGVAETTKLPETTALWISRYKMEGSQEKLKVLEGKLLRQENNLLFYSQYMCNPTLFKEGQVLSLSKDDITTLCKHNATFKLIPVKYPQFTVFMSELYAGWIRISEYEERYTQFRFKRRNYADTEKQLFHIESVDNPNNYLTMGFLGWWVRAKFYMGQVTDDDATWDIRCLKTNDEQGNILPKYLLVPRNSNLFLCVDRTNRLRGLCDTLDVSKMFIFKRIHERSLSTFV